MSRITPKSFLILSVMILLCSSAQAQDLQFSLEIANPNPVGSGARALGRGNAFIAVADDATAASWNPAGLLQLEKPELSFALEHVRNYNGIHSNDHPESQRNGSFRLDDFNYASIAIPFYFFENMVVSLNYLKLFSFENELSFPVTTISNTSVGSLIRSLNYDLEQHGSFSVVAPSFGVDITDHLSLGMTLNIWNHSITQSSRLSKREITTGKQTLAGTPLQPAKHVEINQLEIDKGYSIVLGALVRVNNKLNYGFVVKPAFKLDMIHDTIINGKNVTQPVDSQLDMPFILSAGIAWSVSNPLSLSLDLTWTDWSEYTFLKNGVSKNPLTGRSAHIDKLNDTFTCRMGLEYLVIQDQYMIPLRCGIGYDPAPAVGKVDDFYTMSLGAGLQVYRFNFDIAYEFRWGNYVNGDIFERIDGSQTIRRHRVLASIIYYF